MAGTFKIKIFDIRLDEKLEIEAMQTQALVDANKVLMREQLLEEAKKNMDTIEGVRIYNQIQNEKNKVHMQIKDFFQ